MKIHFLQHAHFEDPGYLLDWAKTNGHTYSSTLLYNNEMLPEKEDFDLLVVMGGPMNIYEEKEFPWLVAEKEFIGSAIHSGKKVLGICLGSQLIADVLGANVYLNKNKEIGWFPIFKNEFNNSNYTEFLPEELLTFHWHGDTFDLPKGAERLYGSETTPNQGFSFNDNVIALQFHWEVKKENVEKMLHFSGDDLKGGGKFVQSPEELLKDESVFKKMNDTLDKFLLFSFTYKI